MMGSPRSLSGFESWFFIGPILPQILLIQRHTLRSMYTLNGKVDGGVVLAPRVPDCARAVPIEHHDGIIVTLRSKIGIFLIVIEYVDCRPHRIDRFLVFVLRDGLPCIALSIVDPCEVFVLQLRLSDQENLRTNSLLDLGHPQLRKFFRRCAYFIHAIICFRPVDVASMLYHDVVIDVRKFLPDRHFDPEPVFLGRGDLLDASKINCTLWFL
jgi:hypothetical protein